jgi:hypothetical protein
VSARLCRLDDARRRSSKAKKSNVACTHRPDGSNCAGAWNICCQVLLGDFNSPCPETRSHTGFECWHLRLPAFAALAARVHRRPSFGQIPASAPRQHPRHSRGLRASRLLRRKGQQPARKFSVPLPSTADRYSSDSTLDRSFSAKRWRRSRERSKQIRERPLTSVARYHPRQFDRFECRDSCGARRTRSTQFNGCADHTWGSRSGDGRRQWPSPLGFTRAPWPRADLGGRHRTRARKAGPGAVKFASAIPILRDRSGQQRGPVATGIDSIGCEPTNSRGASATRPW